MIKKIVLILVTSLMFTGCSSQSVQNNPKEQPSLEAYHGLADKNVYAYICRERGLVNSFQSTTYSAYYSNYYKNRFDFDMTFLSTVADNRYKKIMSLSIGVIKSHCDKIITSVNSLQKYRASQQPAQAYDEKRPIQYNSSRRSQSLKELAKTLQEMGNAAQQASSKALQQSDSFKVPIFNPPLIYGGQRNVQNCYQAGGVWYCP